MSLQIYVRNKINIVVMFSLRSHSTLISEVSGRIFTLISILKRAIQNRDWSMMTLPRCLNLNAVNLPCWILEPRIPAGFWNAARSQKWELILPLHLTPCTVFLLLFVHNWNCCSHTTQEELNAVSAINPKPSDIICI